jgi:hypothetical protein
MKVEEQKTFTDLSRPLGISVPHSWLLPFPAPLSCAPLFCTFPSP